MFTTVSVADKRVSRHGEVVWEILIEINVNQYKLRRWIEKLLLIWARYHLTTRNGFQPYADEKKKEEEEEKRTVHCTF